MAEMDVNSFPTHLAEEEEMHLLEQGILGIAKTQALADQRGTDGPRGYPVCQPGMMRLTFLRA